MNHYQRIRDLREDNDKTQQEIAKILKTTQQQVAKWEAGKHMMSIDKYIILAKEYNISLDYLTGLIEKPRPLNQNLPPQKEKTDTIEILINGKSVHKYSGRKIK